MRPLEDTKPLVFYVVHGQAEWDQDKWIACIRLSRNDAEAMREVYQRQADDFVTWAQATGGDDPNDDLAGKEFWKRVDSDEGFDRRTALEDVWFCAAFEGVQYTIVEHYEDERQNPQNIERERDRQNYRAMRHREPIERGIVYPTEHGRLYECAVCHKVDGCNCDGGRQ